MIYSMNLLLWGNDLNPSFFPTLEKIREIGFGGVEIPIFDTNPASWEPWVKKLDELGLQRQADTFCGADTNLISPDAAVRAHALEHLKRCIDCAALLGAPHLMGPFHSALGVFSGAPATGEEWKWGVEGVYNLAEYAQQQGVVLGLEYLNRFELYLTSCGEELVRFVDDVNHPACRIMFDTFHANIEEKNLGDCIRNMGDRIAFVQLSENDRSTPGKGHVPWDSVFQALTDIDYQGWLSIEAFSPKLTAANIWRKMFDSEEQLMRDGLAFIQGEWEPRRASLVR
jgi:D-psicose/D-tagatose/L-ribulose 3-epimerase